MKIFSTSLPVLKVLLYVVCLYIISGAASKIIRDLIAGLVRELI